MNTGQSHKPCNGAAPKKSAQRTFRVFTNDQRTLDVIAPSLRAALRGAGVKEESIVAAIELHCLPSPENEAQPFLAVLLKNQNYLPPREDA